MKKVVFILIFYTIIILSNQPIFAQANRWQFIGRNDNGSRSYLEKSNQKQTDNKRRTWVKDVFSDGSYKITLISWQCREKRFQTLDSTNYAASGEYIGKERSSAWTTVIPDSVSENYYKVVCASTEQKPAAKSNSSEKKMIAQIITENANIREAPFANGSIIQTVEKGARLFLADAEPTGVWYQVFLPDSDIAGWLHGNTIKLLNIKATSNQRRQKAKPAAKRGETRKRN